MPSSILTGKLPLATPAKAEEIGKSEVERWVLAAIVFATAAVTLGALWDISWHMTIGRDSLWLPPHLLEQFGAAMAGTVCVAYVLWLTLLAPASARVRTVRFWGLHGPLGAWVCIWGALAIIASLPFDDWWHVAYGRDFELLSPPHAVLMLGVLGIHFGTLLFALTARSPSATTDPGSYGRIYTYSVGVLIVITAFALYGSLAYPNQWHNIRFYKETAKVFPFLLLGVARLSPWRWAATAAAASYTGIMLLTLWALQLVAAQPKLALIYTPLNHMVPMAFPVLLIAPAIAIDLIERRLGGRNDWIVAVCAGLAFVGVMMLVHWPGGEFMLSPAAQIFFFGGDQWPYMYQPDAWQHEFWPPFVNRDGSWALGPLARRLGPALVFAILSARVGLLWAGFTKRVVR